MSHPLNELKRRLADEATPLPKRFRLAKYVVLSHHFPTTPKERVIGEWLEDLISNNKITNKDLRDILSWLNNVDDLTVELKYKLIKIVSCYLHNNVIQYEDVQHIADFIENSKISSQLTVQIEDFLSVTMTLLQNLSSDETTNILLVDKLLDIINKYYKDCKKKLEFILKFIEEENLETVFGLLNTGSMGKVINLCQNILFPINKRSFFARYLNNLIRKDDLANILEEKNDNMESVIKIMNVFMTSKGNQQFLSHFIKVFVSCFKSESQLLFAFYIIAVNCLGMTQSYINTVSKFAPIALEGNSEKIKRNLFLNMLNVLLENEVDINVHLRDTLNERSKETKKTFLLLLQEVLIGTIKMEGKPDKTSLNIIKAALKLDPSLIEQKILEILPPIMISKKGTNVIETYTDTINVLLQTLFKLSKGMDFIHNLLPTLKSSLENFDTNQTDLKEQLNESVMSNNGDCEKLRSKIVNGYDILPKNCIETYGKLTSELMFRQNKDLLGSLQKDLEEILKEFETGNDSPSLITLTEVLSAILSSFLRHNKMADHTVPLQIGEDFWATYQNFEDQCLKKFGECVLKLEGCPLLLKSFLDLCISFTQLKLLNIKYSNINLEFHQYHNSDVFDLTLVLPCLSEEQWKEIASKVNENDCELLLNNLLLVKTMAIQILKDKSATDDSLETISNMKSHLIKQLSTSPNNMLDSCYSKALFANLDKNQARQLAKCLIKLSSNYSEIEVFRSDCLLNNKTLLNAVVYEVIKHLSKKIENLTTLSKSVGKDAFEIISFLKNVNMKEFLDTLSVNTEDYDEILKYIEVMKNLQVFYLDENCQLTVIFVLLILKKCCNTKKIKRPIDYILQSIFELSTKTPDLFKLLSCEFIFDFENGILKLLKLNAKTSNHGLIIKNVLESATKKVKKDPNIIKTLVGLLLNQYKKKEISSIEHFSEEVFQIICILLPLIAKEKKNIKTSVYRSILADLQEDLNKAMLLSFKSVDFESSIFNTSNTDDSVISENGMAILNAMGAYALTLSKCCETNDGTEVQSMDCLWSGLEFFIQNAIHSIENPETKSLHVDSSIQLLTVILRYIKKLEKHDIFKNKDKLLLQIWRAVKSRLFIVLDHRLKKNESCLEDIAVTLKFLAELSSVECFVNNFVADLNMLCILKKPSIILKNEEITSTQIISRKVLKYLCLNILNSYIIEAKCIAFTKLIFRSTKNLRFWIQQHYTNAGENQNGVTGLHVVKIEDPICELVKIDLNVLAEVILAAKKISLDYKFIDAIFELQQLIHYILGRNFIDTRCEVTWQSFFALFEGSVAILNSMILSRDELLEDRWPCLMQCYKTLVLCMCERSTSHNDLERSVEHKLAEIAHSIEKLTQSISKRKTHVSRIAAYAVADFCTWLEKSPPPKMIRQHLENSIVLLIQASDSNYAMAFLRRSLAGSIGQMTLTNMHTMYKRYHKYVGNA